VRRRENILTEKPHTGHVGSSSLTSNSYE